MSTAPNLDLLDVVSDLSTPIIIANAGSTGWGLGLNTKLSGQWQTPGLEGGSSPYVYAIVPIDKEWEIDGVGGSEVKPVISLCSLAPSHLYRLYHGLCLSRISEDVNRRNGKEGMSNSSGAGLIPGYSIESSLVRYPKWSRMGNR